MARLENFRYNERYMSEGLQELTAEISPDAQRNAIVGIADVRRQTQTLSAELDSLTKDPTYIEVPEPLRNIYDEQYRLVTRVMQGTADLDLVRRKSQTENISTQLANAEQFRDTAPRLAAFHFAKLASLQQASGADYAESLSQAKRCLDASKKLGIPRETPADFLPDAYILGIAKNASKGAAIPPPQIMAQAIQLDPSLLKDYALVLSESQRGQFLTSFPEDKRAQISLQLDRAVSEVLNRKHITASADVEQRDAVKDRMQEIFVRALSALKSSSSQKSSNGRGIGDRWTAKQITETIVNLGGEDSIRFIKNIAELAVREVKDLNKDLKKKPSSERKQTLQPSISFNARVLDTLISVDVGRGGVLAMRYLEMSVLPDRLFSFFAQKLIAKKYFTKNLSSFLSDSGNIPVIKKIMAKYGPQFNTIVDTIAQTSGYGDDHKLVSREAELFEALADLNTLTPRIFSRYRSLSLQERKAFAERIRILKPRFFRNTPIKGILNKSDQDILAEMVYMAYKPMQMSFKQVENLIEKVDDHTGDLSKYTFPEDGYPITLERSVKYVLKDQQRVDLSTIRRYRSLLLPITVSEHDREKLSFAQAVKGVLQFPQAEKNGELDGCLDNNLRVLFQPFQAQSQVKEFLERYSEVSPNNAFQAESELAEIMGVYFRDNYTRILTEYLSSRPVELQQIIKLISNVNLRNAITERLEQFNEVFTWDEFDRVAKTSKRGFLHGFASSPPSSEAQSLTAKLLTQLIEHEHVEPIRKRLQSELSKFALSGTDSSPSYRGALKAYVSKNVGSFFAKAAAGICTSEDIPLFERPDHFHINIVENDEIVRANIQAYITQVDGKPSLVLRGFNPTADWIGKIDIEGFCEQILAIGRQFQRDNGLGGIYITEQGGWHALSNRTQIADWLIKRYEEGKAAIPLSLQVASSHNINAVYRV